MLEVHGGLLFWTVVTFLALLFVLGKYVWRPLLNMLDERETKIIRSLEDVEKAAMSAKEAEVNYKDTIEKGRAEAMDIVQSGKSAADKIKEELVADARKRAEALTAQAEQQIQSEKDKALQDIRKEAAEIIILATQAILKREMDTAANRALIDETLKAIETRHEA